MAATLLNFAAQGIGQQEVIPYQVPDGKTAMLLGCLVTNVTGTALPVDVTVRKGAVDIRLAVGKRIPMGDNIEVVKGKVVLAAGDAVVVRANASNGADALLSIAEGV